MAVLDGIFTLWVFTSLSKTLAQLQARRAGAKLDLYRRDPFNAYNTSEPHPKHSNFQASPCETHRRPRRLCLCLALYCTLTLLYCRYCKNIVPVHVWSIFKCS